MYESHILLSGDEVSHISLGLQLMSVHFFTSEWRPRSVMVIFFLPVNVIRVLGVAHFFPRLPCVSEPSSVLCDTLWAVDGVDVRT